MKGGPRPSLIDYVHQVARSVGGEECTDRQLLDRFIQHQDERAFEGLLRRHGPLVFGVCRRALLDLHEAEDAFQATFLVLARKAGTLQRGELLANWLYGVALRIARKARARAGKRRSREQALLADIPALHHEAACPERAAMLDEEIRRLPGKYRLPVLLYYLEHQSVEATARQLACPVGTVKSRLSWARERLRTRLLRRGITTGMASLAIEGLADASRAAVPVALVQKTLPSAIAFAASSGVGAPGASGAVLSLTQAVLRGTLMAKVKKAAGVGMLVLFLGMGPGSPGPAPELLAERVPGMAVQSVPLKARLPEAPSKPAIQPSPATPVQVAAAPGMHRHDHHHPGANHFLHGTGGAAR